MRGVRIATAGLTLALAGCMVLPVTREVYDPECRTMRKQMTLEAATVGYIASCHAEDCAALLATLGVVGAASVVVSGSIALVGNVVYWFEHQGRCGRQRDAARASDAAVGNEPREGEAAVPLPRPSPAEPPAPARPLPVPGMLPHPQSRSPAQPPVLGAVAAGWLAPSATPAA
jgi:hypothetical protein